MTGAMNIRSLPENCIHVYYVRVDSARDFAQSEKRILSSQEQEVLQKLQRASDYRSYATAHLMLRRVLADYCGESPDALQISRSEFGKPFLLQAPNEKSIEFNLTHCESLVACAVARVPVGIDVEPVTRVLDTDVARIILSAKEQAALASMSPTNRQHSLLQIWTFKEASLKAMGKGLYHEPSKVEIDVENGDFASALILQTPPCSPIRCQLFDVSITPADHFLSVATTVPGSYQLSSIDFDI